MNKKNIIITSILILFLSNSFEKELQNDEITILSDETFDSFLREYSQYTHFIILYRSTCGRCLNARKEIRKIFTPKNFDTKNIRFSEIELLKNSRTKYRFNIIDTPVLILVKNNKYIELSKFPSEKNIITFLKSEFENPKDIPKQISSFIYYLKFCDEKITSLSKKINEYLESRGMQTFKVEPIMIYAIFIVIIFIIIILYICGRSSIPKINKDKKE